MQQQQQRARTQVRIADVAKRAGTSPATVSHVLRQTGKFVNPELAERVVEAAHALDYRPNGVARALRTKRTGEIGVIVPDLRDHRHTLLLKGCAAAAQLGGLGMLLEDSEGSWAREADVARNLLEKQVEGLIVAPVGGANAAVQHAARAGVPVVLAGGLLAGTRAPAVLADAERGACEAVSHLLAMGYGRVAILAGALDTTLRRDCFAGYQRALSEHGLELDSTLVCTQPSDLVGGYKGMMQLLRSRRPPRAVFVVEHSMALGAVKALAKHGYRCPEDVAVVAVGDYEWAEAMTPSLTVVSLPSYEMGRAAVERLIGLMRGVATGRATGRAVPRVTRLPTRLIVRGSTDPSQEETIWDAAGIAL